MDETCSPPLDSYRAWAVGKTMEVSLPSTNSAIDSTLINYGSDVSMPFVDSDQEFHINICHIASRHVTTTCYRTQKCHVSGGEGLTLYPRISRLAKQLL